MLKPEVLNSPAKLRELPIAELMAAHHELKASQMKLRLQHAIGQVEKTHVIREARRQRARLLTIISQVRAGETVKAKAAKPATEAQAHADKPAARQATPVKKKTATHKSAPSMKAKPKMKAKTAAKQPAKKAAKKK